MKKDGIRVRWSTDSPDGKLEITRYTTHQTVVEEVENLKARIEEREMTIEKLIGSKVIQQ